MTNCPIQGVSKEGGGVPGKPNEKMLTAHCGLWMYCKAKAGGGLRAKKEGRMLNGCGRCLGASLGANTWAWENFSFSSPGAEEANVPLFGKIGLNFILRYDTLLHSVV